MPGQRMRTSMIDSLGIVVRSGRLATVAKVPGTVDVESVPVAHGLRRFVVLFRLNGLVVSVMISHVESPNADVDVQWSTRFLLPKSDGSSYLLPLIIRQGFVWLHPTYSDIVLSVIRQPREFDGSVSAAATRFAVMVMVMEVH